MYYPIKNVLGINYYCLSCLQVILKMSSDDCAQFQAINKHCVDGYIYEIIAFEDILLRKDEEFSLQIDFGSKFSSGYIGFILNIREKTEYLEFSPNYISSLETNEIIEIRYTGENTLSIKSGDKLGAIIVLKLSEALDIDEDLEDFSDN